MKYISGIFLVAVCFFFFSPQFSDRPAVVEAALPCNGCHDYPPADATGGRGVPEGAVFGSHAIHAGTGGYGLSCPVCHVTPNWTSAGHQNGLVEAAANISSGSYSKGTSFIQSNNPIMGTCANTYCHGNYPGSGKKAAPEWGNSASGTCGSCHEAANNSQPQTGNHTRHTFTGFDGYNIQCTACHKDIVTGNGPASYTIADKTKHASGFIDWKFDTSDPRVLPSTSYSIATGTASPSDGSNPRAYGTCNNTYCHSIAQTSTGGPLTGQAGEYKETFTWGTYIGVSLCGTCHDGGHGYSLDSGSHGRHMLYEFNMYGTSTPTHCTICHKWNSSGGYGDCNQCHYTYDKQTYHVNGQVDVIFDQYWGPAAAYNGTPQPGDGYSNCANTYCHSNGTGGTKNTGEIRGIAANNSMAWGSGSLSCTSCHGNYPSYANGSPKANSHADHGYGPGLCFYCHGATTSNGSTITDTAKHVNGTYDVSNNSWPSMTYQYYSDGGTCTNVPCHTTPSLPRKWGTKHTLYFKSNADQNSISDPTPNAYLAASGTYAGVTTYSTGTTGSPGRRFMSLTPGTTQENMQQTLVIGSGRYYRIAQFVSPQVTAAATIPNGSQFYIIMRGVQSSSSNAAYARYTLYKWNANDSQGTNFRTIAQYGTNLPTAATNMSVGFTSSSEVTFAVGDRIVCEIELYAFGAASGTATLSWGNSTSNAKLVLPVLVRF